MRYTRCFQIAFAAALLPGAAIWLALTHPGTAAATPPASAVPAAAMPPASTTGANVVHGGPFQRVVYRVRSHTVIAVPGGLRQGDLTFRAPSLQYNELTRVGWAAGLCSITTPEASATASEAISDFGRRLVTLRGRVHCTLQSVRRGQQPVHVTLDCPEVAYSTATGVVDCTGGVSGSVSGINQITAVNLPGVSSPSGTTREPVAVRAAAIRYDSRARVLQALGAVQLTRSGTTVHAGQLDLDLARNMLKMAGGVEYRDPAGHRFAGAQAVEDLSRRSMLVVGPVTYSDTRGNTVHSQSAALDERSQLASFNGQVEYTSAQGFDVTTPWVTIQSGPGGDQAIRTGPLHIHGSTS